MFTGYYGNAYDPHRKVDLTNHLDIVKENINNNNPNNHYFELIKGDSKDINICNQVNKTIDFLFIDGQHDTMGVRMDFLNLKNKVNKGGLIVFDNYNDPSWPDVKRAVDDLIEKYNLKVINKIGHCCVICK